LRVAVLVADNNGDGVYDKKVCAPKKTFDENSLKNSGCWYDWSTDNKPFAAYRVW
jgi:hypothetical protein